MKNFEDLESWKLGREIRNEVREITKSFSVEEKYRLTDQLVRSSRSVTANIAEGYGRYHYQENIQFCRQARGSLNEVLDHLICAFDNDYIDLNKLNSIREKIEHAIKVLNGYISYFKEEKRRSGYWVIKLTMGIRLIKLIQAEFVVINLFNFNSINNLTNSPLNLINPIN